MTDESDDAGPRYAVLTVGAGDAVTAIADEARAALHSFGRRVDVTTALPDPPADGLLVVAGGGSLAPVMEAAESYRGRAVAVVIVGGERGEATAIGSRLRNGLRPKGVFVPDRQVWFPADVFSVYGLQSDDHRDRLHALLDLFDHDAERLHATREGWEEPDAAPRDVEWIGPQVGADDE